MYNFSNNMLSNTYSMRPKKEINNNSEYVKISNEDNQTNKNLNIDLKSINFENTAVELALNILQLNHTHYHQMSKQDTIIYYNEKMKLINNVNIIMALKLILKYKLKDSTIYVSKQNNIILNDNNTEQVNLDSKNNNSKTNNSKNNYQDNSIPVLTIDNFKITQNNSNDSNNFKITQNNSNNIYNMNSLNNTNKNFLNIGNSVNPDNFVNMNTNNNNLNINQNINRNPNQNINRNSNQNINKNSNQNINRGYISNEKINGKNVISSIDFDVNSIINDYYNKKNMNFGSNR
jgi:hypothetical protein